MTQETWWKGGRKSVRAGQRSKCCAAKGDSQDSESHGYKLSKPLPWVMKAVKMDGERFSPIALTTSWVESSRDAALVSRHWGWNGHFGDEAASESLLSNLSIHFPTDNPSKLTDSLPRVGWNHFFELLLVPDLGWIEDCSCLSPRRVTEHQPRSHQLSPLTTNLLMLPEHEPQDSRTYYSYIITSLLRRNLKAFRRGNTVRCFST